MAKLVHERMEIQFALEAPEPGRGIIFVDQRWSMQTANLVIAKIVPFAIEALQGRLLEIDLELVELGMSID